MKNLFLAMLFISNVLGATASAKHVVPVDSNQHTQSAIKGLAGIDTYGSSQVVIEEIINVARPEIEAYVQADIQGNQIEKQDAETRAINQIHALGDFAYVGFSMITYHSSASQQGKFLSIDIVDKQEENRRMSFLPEPTGNPQDPDRLISEWREYERKGWELVKQGMIQFPVDCPVLHCTTGFSHPNLNAYLEIFDQGANKNFEELLDVFRHHKDPSSRAAAAFLLVHSKKNEKIILDELSFRIRDSSKIVRNNVLRVFADAGFRKPGIQLPVEAVIDAFDFPTTLDRNKALAILSTAANDPSEKTRILNGIGIKLIDVLKLKQPNNREFAHIILVRLAGKDFGATNYEAWKYWVTQELSDSMI